MDVDNVKEEILGSSALLAPLIAMFWLAGWAGVEVTIGAFLLVFFVFEFTNVGG